MGKVEEIIESVKSWPLQNMLRGVYNSNSYLDNGQLLERIINAMALIDRRLFVGNDPRNIENAYQDGVLSIGEGQTISQPTTVARMLIYADLQKGQDVLEVGTGSGWNASLIAYLVHPGKVMSVDRFESLIRNARENLQNLQKHFRLKNIEFLNENVFDKKSEIWKRKYDKIIITAGIPNYSQNIEEKVENLAENLLNRNGILVCPYTDGPMIIYKKNGKLNRRKTEGEYYSFVPLVEK